MDSDDEIKVLVSELKTRGLDDDYIISQLKQRDYDMSKVEIALNEYRSNIPLHKRFLSSNSGNSVGRDKISLKKIFLLILLVFVLIGYTVFHFAVNVGDHYKTQQNFHDSMGDYDALRKIFLGEPELVEEHAKFFAHFSTLELVGGSIGWLEDYFQGRTVVEDMVWLNRGSNPNDHTRSREYAVVNTLVNNSGVYYIHTRLKDWKKTEQVRYWDQKMKLDSYSGDYNFQYTKVPFGWKIDVITSTNIVVTDSASLYFGLRFDGLVVVDNDNILSEDYEISIYNLHTDDLLCREDLKTQSTMLDDGTERIYYLADCLLQELIWDGGPYNSLFSIRFEVQDGSNSVNGYALLRYW